MRSAYVREAAEKGMCNIQEEHIYDNKHLENKSQMQILLKVMKNTRYGEQSSRGASLAGKKVKISCKPKVNSSGMNVFPWMDKEDQLSPNFHDWQGKICSRFTFILENLLTYRPRRLPVDFQDHDAAPAIPCLAS